MMISIMSCFPGKTPVKSQQNKPAFQQKIKFFRIKKTLMTIAVLNTPDTIKQNCGDWPQKHP